VTRERIIEKIWGKDVFLDADTSINSAIRKIRQVLLRKSRPAAISYKRLRAEGTGFIAQVGGGRSSSH